MGERRCAKAGCAERTSCGGSALVVRAQEEVQAVQEEENLDELGPGEGGVLNERRIEHQQHGAHRDGRLRPPFEARAGLEAPREQGRGQEREAAEQGGDQLVARKGRANGAEEGAGDEVC